MDRLQHRLELLLALMVVAGAIMVAVVAGNAEYASQSSVLQEQRAQRHQVAAVLTTDVRTSPAADGADMAGRAGVRWTDADGERHTGSAPVRATQEKGDTIRIWTDGSGRMTGPPRFTSAETAAWVAALMSAGAVAAAGIGARYGLRRLADRHRYRAWEEEWRIVEPTWSRRRRA
ncbi:hypothetical protein N566_00370 [Streptomycetaceae bacterium MP113-05]|nr:hypothetical protein N566_00370 [Streptomycetaceae bacterium MP113-05]